MIIKSLNVLTANLNLDQLSATFPKAHGHHHEPNCGHKPKPQSFNQQALALIAARSEPSRNSNYNYSNDLPSMLQSLGGAYRAQRKQRQEFKAIKSAILDKFFGPSYRSNSLANYFSGLGNNYRGYSSPRNYNNSSNRDMLRDLLSLTRMLRSNDNYASNNSRSAPSYGFSLNEPKGDCAKPSPSSLLSYFVPQKNISPYHDDHHDNHNLDNSGYGFSLSSNQAASHINPTGFTSTADRKAATLNYGNSSVAFNQADQSVTVTDRTTLKSFKIHGDPHEEFGNHKGDFIGTKTYKMADGTKMTLVTGKPAGNNDPNAPTTVQSAIFAKKGLDAVEVKNITANKLPDGTYPGIVADYISEKDAKKAARDSVSTVTVNADGTLKK
jgi:Domain of Unknown Function (DUF1521)